MRAAGIIAEYNPFHNGHLHHLTETRRLSGHAPVVAVMSGNFAQRGEPAIFDKWARAELAVRSGVDLVLELPVAFAVRSAQYFAAGGVRLLQAVGVVDTICFGAEHPDISLLDRLAAAINDDRVLAGLKTRLANGETYAAAFGRALTAGTGLPAAAVAAPNNILAVEYLRAIRQYAPDLLPLPLPRRDVGHHDTDIPGAIASATAIRRALVSGETDRAASAMPPAGRELVGELCAKGLGPVTWDSFALMLLARLRQAGLAELAALPDVSEGLEYKLKTGGVAASGFAELLTMIKSKRYSRTRLQRIAVHALLATRRTEFAAMDAAGPLYARVLAFNDQGRVLLRAMETAAAVPVITKTTHFLSGRELAGTELSPLQAMLALDVMATDLYTLGLPNPALRQGGWDFRRSPLYIPGPSSKA